MQALVIVVLTLSSMGGLLFGSDYVDRRLTGRSGGLVATPTSMPEAAAAVADAVAGRCDRDVRPAGARHARQRPAAPARRLEAADDVPVLEPAAV
ncbi:MAG TPA: hypothetical protein VK306_05180 [Acidimicrobiales bacterium]|nr:hypothetical protein [Acidimicrobiales bacterium]